MATRVKIRRQGGARIVTLPASLLARIGADAGTTLALDVRSGAIVAKPVAEPVAEPAPAPRRRFTLSELLVGAEHLPDLYRGVDGALDGDPVGNEIG